MRKFAWYRTARATLMSEIVVISGSAFKLAAVIFSFYRLAFTIVSRSIPRSEITSFRFKVLLHEYTIRRTLESFINPFLMLLIWICLDQTFSWPDSNRRLTKPYTNCNACLLDPSSWIGSNRFEPTWTDRNHSNKLEPTRFEPIWLHSNRFELTQNDSNQLEPIRTNSNQLELTQTDSN